MTGRAIIVACLLQAGVCAQLELLQVDPKSKSETPVTSSVLDLGSVAPGDTLVTSFHVKNLGSAPVNMLLNVAGAGFTRTIYDLNPCILLPAAIAPPIKACGYFDVLFSPSSVGSVYNAALTVSGGSSAISLTLRGTAAAQAMLTAGGDPLAANTTVDFGQTERGTAAEKTFTLSNPASVPVHVGSISVSGSAFTGPAGISPPLDLQPGASTSFQVAFAPQTAGQATGTLLVDQRSFNLTGLATVPPLPKGTITISSQTPSSGQQLSVSVALASTSKVSGNGTLTLAFQPAPGLPDDPAVQFLSGSKRAATLTIAPGDSSAKFNGQASLPFQTGTTAGTIVLTLTLSNSTDQLTIPIAPALVNVSAAVGTRRIDAMDVSITGFDNTHTASQLAFTFYDSAGHTLQPGVIRVDAAPNFKQYFAANAAGGAFAMLASFPVTGDTLQIASVDVQISNSAGIMNTQRITF